MAATTMPTTNRIIPRATASMPAVCHFFLAAGSWTRTEPYRNRMPPKTTSKGDVMISSSDRTGAIAKRKSAGAAMVGYWNNKLKKRRSVRNPKAHSIKYP